MSWKKRNQKLRGPRARKAKSSLKIYSCGHAGKVSFYADPRHGVRVAEENGTWFYERVTKDAGTLRTIFYRPPGDPKYERWALPDPAIWAATAAMMSQVQRKSYTALHQKTSKRKRRDCKARLQEFGYKAIADVIPDNNSLAEHFRKSSKAFLELPYKDLV